MSFDVKQDLSRQITELEWKATEIESSMSGAKLYLGRIKRQITSLKSLSVELNGDAGKKDQSAVDAEAGLPEDQ